MVEKDHSQSSVTKPSGKLFAPLEGWRGICAMGIVLLHFPSTTFIDGKTSIFVSNFYLFVDFFFVLSGFVITHSYGDRLTRFADVWRFMALRFWRLYPVHVLLLLALIAFQVFKWYFDGFLGGKVGEGILEKESLSSILTHLLLIHSLGFTPSHHWNGPSWSISTEFYTYLLFALIWVITVHRIQLRWAAIVGLAVGSVIVLAILPGNLTVERDFGLFRCIYGFAMGYFTYRVYRHFEATIGQLSDGTFRYCEALVVLAVIAQLIWFGQELASLSAPVIFAVFVFVFAFEGGPVSALFSKGPALYLGRLSYSMYMIHGFISLCLNGILRVVQQLTGTTLLSFNGESYRFGTDTVTGFFWLFIYLGLVVLTSQILFKFFEDPLRQFGRNRVAVRGKN